MSLRLQILSASLTILARGESDEACSTCRAARLHRTNIPLLFGCAIKHG